MRNRTLCLAFLAVTVLCGCQAYLFSPYFTVKENGLNWIAIRHYNYKTTPIQRVNVRIDGGGMVTVREGTSMLVNNPFAANASESHWNDIRETRITLTPGEVVPLFQMLVDKGLFKERVKLGKESVTTNEAIFVSANLEGKTCGSEDDIFEVDPDLAESLKMITLLFYHPQPKQRR